MSETLRMSLRVAEPATVASTRFLRLSKTRRGATTLSTVKLAVSSPPMRWGSSRTLALRRRSLKLEGMPDCCMSEKRCTARGRVMDWEMERAVRTDEGHVGLVDVGEEMHGEGQVYRVGNGAGGACQFGEGGALI